MSNDKQYSDDAFDPAWIDAQLDTIGRGADKVIPLLQAIQKRYNYLPRPVLVYLSENSDITPADVVGISTFYSQFRHTPAGRHCINVCVGTACHVKGADLVYDSFHRHLGCAEGADTDSRGLFTVNKVACLGCCSLAVAVQIDDIIYGHVTAAGAGDIIKDFLGRQKTREGGKGAAYDDNKNLSAANEIRVSLGSCCVASGSAGAEAIARETIARYNLPVNVKHVGCVGMCHRTPLIEVIANGASQYYANIKPDDVPGIILNHFRPTSLVNRAICWVDTAAESLLLSEPALPAASRLRIDRDDKAVDGFFNKQKHIAIEHYGAMTPLDIDEYISKGGFEALKKCLRELNVNDIADILDDSGLRGRGGAGFPAGIKWEAVKGHASMKESSPSEKSALPDVYLICNGDEGDPGAYMDRMLLESFPYRIIEGMLIAAYAVGAGEAIFYIRAEYPYALKIIRAAIDICEKRNFIGGDILGSKFSVKFTVVEGAGAFVCGEETALIKSIEGKRGMPALKPPFPAASGLRGKPTLINNCETFACVPWIIANGAEKFKSIGTPESPGTKVFALTGKIARGGLIETPMGITVKEIVEHIGGGIANGKKFKAIQIGGPSGGCIPAEMGSIPIDFERLAGAGAMMGSGGLVALDESDCMVDIARYFLTFTQDQSCGRCTFCRVGTKKMLGILEKICGGNGTAEDLQTLEELAAAVKSASLCGLGKTAPNPVLTTLKYFRSEYEAHISGECPAGKCKEMITYSITDKCTTGCTICSQVCPVDAIPFTPYSRHSIDDALCTRCDVCRAACPEDAIEIVPRKKADAV
ncbi:MAG: NAD(P)H-dependent oxidoreductase subunit E [Chitinispirillales bacterium]|jgi:NADH:ubiquinone oxidoreductase subunit F (NADH-binding)/NADH:ubiquinone oxidoreductase subunit E/Pyruvate/2-oxoacid:ferredoxin oxidoreductase delta subunit|nr:NAD(P)H-dependent oxidoreductase subunit E [Chitinispirillales bacterium]